MIYKRYIKSLTSEEKSKMLLILLDYIMDGPDSELRFCEAEDKDHQGKFTLNDHFYWTATGEDIMDVGELMIWHHTYFAEDHQSFDTECGNIGYSVVMVPDEGVFCERYDAVTKEVTLFIECESLERGKRICEEDYEHLSCSY